ncbi:MAG: TRAP transporter substrate-binding protein DctP [Desulfofustis sp.]|jgi:TRAP-type C4-dicarboxylate transport system substrate-binding protein|nr:TRAP transporter substrate-binding protein DctP [Desulfofustis sp.]
MIRKLKLLVMFMGFFAFLCTGLLGMASAADYKYKWRLAQTMPEDSDHHRRCVAFAEEVKEKTEGRIEIEVYSGSVLGDWVDVNEYIMRGDVDMGLLPLAPTYDPRLNIGYYMPYMFTNTEEAKAAYNVGGWVYDMVNALLEEQGIKGLAIYPAGWAGVTTKEEPVGWQEMKPNKMKIRVMPLKACQLTWEALGYIPSTIPYSEAYSAIERGVADGESGGPPFQGYQFRDIQGVWIQTNDFLEPFWFFMNLEKFNSLTKEDQDVLVAAAQKQVDGRWDYFLKEDEEYRQKMADYGMKVLIPTDEQLKGFAEKVRTEVWPKLEELIGKRLVDQCRENVGMPVK